MLGCFGGGCAGLILTLVVFALMFNAALTGAGPGHLFRIVIVLLLDAAVVGTAYAAITVWAPRARNPNLVRTFALTAGIIGLGGLTLCSGVLSGQ